VNRIGIVCILKQINGGLSSAGVLLVGLNIGGETEREEGREGGREGGKEEEQRGE
jgi:hypothetical protein